MIYVRHRLQWSHLLVLLIYLGGGYWMWGGNPYPSVPSVTFAIEQRKGHPCEGSEGGLKRAATMGSTRRS